MTVWCVVLLIALSSGQSPMASCMNGAASHHYLVLLSLLVRCLLESQTTSFDLVSWTRVNMCRIQRKEEDTE
jgi:hypothetical protein